jgi:hypothetical protein
MTFIGWTGRLFRRIKMVGIPIISALNIPHDVQAMHPFIASPCATDLGDSTRLKINHCFRFVSNPGIAVSANSCGLWKSILLGYRTAVSSDASQYPTEGNMEHGENGYRLIFKMERICLHRGWEFTNFIDSFACLLICDCMWLRSENCP